MHKLIAHGNEAANCERMPIIADTLDTYVECVVVTEFVYALQSR